MQSDRIGLHWHLLGSEIRNTETLSGKPRQLFVGAQTEDRKIVRVSEN
jgi:hypothetical protein